MKVLRWILVGVVVVGAVGVAVRVSQVKRAQVELAGKIRDIESRTVSPGPTEVDDGGEGLAILEELHAWLAIEHPIEREPEAVVDAPWAWGLNHPPVIYPYLDRMARVFAEVDRALEAPAFRVRSVDRFAGDVASAALRLHRLLIARSWQELRGNDDPMAAARLVGQSLELADRLDAGTFGAHTIRTGAIQRACGVLRWILDHPDTDAGAIRDYLDPVLARVGDGTRFDRALATEVRRVAALKDRLSRGGGPVQWWLEPARIRSFVRTLAALDEAVRITGVSYLVAREELDRLVAAHPAPSAWESRNRIELVPRLRGYERSIEARVQIAMVRTGFALVEYRQAEGDYPADLAELAPLFDVGFPIDERTGVTLDYGFRDDGGVVLTPASVPERQLALPGRNDPPRDWTLPLP